jgi:tRNA (mo5U34)-methyltransferase
MISLDAHYLEPFKDIIHLPEIQKIIQDRASYLERRDCPAYWQALKNQPQITAKYRSSKDGVIHMGRASELSAAELRKVASQLNTFISWRKGPFSIFDIYIDSEWQSNLKWDRILPYLDSLEDKIICDVGCNNGYYMFRMAEHRPKLVLGLDPIHRYKFVFQYLNNFAGESNLFMELLGLEQLHLFPGFFDTIFLMGIVYHHRNPLEVLSQAWKALKPHGQLIVDSMGIPGAEPHALFPGRRYTKAPGIWFLPTQSCLKNWLDRTGFKSIKCIYNEELKASEQRRTAWSPHESLSEFLDPMDQSKTVEGFPRPRRIYFVARKKPR